MIRSACLSLLLLLLPAVAWAQDVPAPPNEEVLSEAYRGRSYSPYANRNFPSRPLWGDTHLHTGLSLDAGAFGARLDPRDAHRFARGEQVTSANGTPARLSRPLDWLVVADHSDQMGFILDLLDGQQHLLAEEKGREWYDQIQNGEGVAAAMNIIKMFAEGSFPEGIARHYQPGARPYRAVWERTVNAAEEYNEPGRYTAFIGYEWTSLVNNDNLHRVVIYRDDAQRALQTVPYTTYPPQGSPNPRDLWRWMEAYEERTGGDVLAIAHNGNMGNGTMFPLEAQYDGTPLDADYVTARDQWEPLYEATQIKGDSETHPFLSPDDEFADFETWDFGNFAPWSDPKQDEMLAGEYVRSGLLRGLQIERRLGVNPYQFGLIGSTDSHTGMATAQEDNFFGKHAGSEPSPERMNHPFLQGQDGTIYMAGWGQSASGLAAVWAEENTRESIFDAMERRETYATTGSRMAIRFFGGWDYEASDLQSRTPAFAGYEKGVPMGGQLRRRGAAEAPTFMVYALRDPIGANLDRIQIVKGWLDAEGNTHERVYDVVWSGARRPGADGRLPAVGNTVDAETASFTNSIGASELGTVWTDPEFDPALSAFYYARVIEIPTPRWTTIDAFRFGVEIPEGAPVSIQERGYTSPIWYTPVGQ
jgi:Protein of unknown function (DUF3604)